MARTKIANLLAEMENTMVDPSTGTVSTKTAGNSESKVDLGKVAAAKKELLAAVKDAETAKSEKTASAADTSDVSSHLMKMAADLANVEEHASLKQAQLLGAAAADGFVARLNQHGAVSGSGEKTAGANDDDSVKLAMEAGYNDGLRYVEQARRGGQDKQAAFNQGHNDTVTQIQQLAQTAEGRQKLAQINAGYENTMQQAEKLASDCLTRGYQDTIAVLQQLA